MNHVVWASLLALGLATSGAVAQESGQPVQPAALWVLEPAPAAAQGGELAAPDAPRRLALNPDAFAAPPGRTLLLPLPGDETARLRVFGSRPVLTGGRRISARFVDGDGEFFLQQGLNTVHGGFTRDGVSYRVFGPVGGPLTVERDHGDRLGDDLVVADPLIESTRRRATPNSTVEGNRVVDIFFLYDQSMIDEHGWGLADLAANDVGVLHDALAYSGVPLEAAVTDLEFVELDENYGGGGLLGDALAEVGVFAAPAERTRTLSADIMSINRVGRPDRESFCGIAQFFDPTQDYPLKAHYNVCHGSMVLAHETGHNLGLSHGVATDGPDFGGIPEEWARGFRIDSVDRDGGIYTSIMAYGDRHRPYSFSDPNRTCPERGSVCGVPVGEEFAADATRALTEFGVQNGTAATPLDRLSTAVLPTSRNVTTGEPATVFMTVINPNEVAGENCVIRHHGPDREGFGFQETDPATNGLVGEANTPFDLDAGAARTFLVSLTPSTDVANVAFAPFASCDNMPMNAVHAGLNAVNLGASATRGADIIALSATLGGDGIVDIPDDGRAGAFAVATINMGDAADVTVSAESLDPILPATAQICQTDAAGACMAARADSVTVTMPVGASPTFAVFVRTDYATPFNATRRFQVQFEADGALRGSTSVAVRNAAGLVPPTASDLAVDVVATQSVTAALADYADGYLRRYAIVDAPAAGSVELDADTGEFTYTANALGGTDRFTWRVRNSAGWSEAAAVDVTISDLPIPEVADISRTDDTDGRFVIDLDDVSSGVIDGFALTEEPDVPSFDFNTLSGELDITLPADPGVVSFSYEALNASGSSTSGSASIDVIAFDVCLPENATAHRVERRLMDYPVSVEGVATIAEAEAMLGHICLDDLTRSEEDRWIYGVTDTTPQGGVYLIPGNSNWIGAYYSVFFLSQDEAGDNVWRRANALCKTPGSRELTRCD